MGSSSSGGKDREPLVVVSLLNGVKTIRMNRPGKLNAWTVRETRISNSNSLAVLQCRRPQTADSFLLHFFLLRRVPRHRPSRHAGWLTHSLVLPCARLAPRAR